MKNILSGNSPFFPGGGGKAMPFQISWMSTFTFGEKIEEGPIFGELWIMNVIQSAPSINTNILDVVFFLGVFFLLIKCYTARLSTLTYPVNVPSGMIGAHTVLPKFLCQLRSDWIPWGHVTGSCTMAAGGQNKRCRFVKDWFPPCLFSVAKRLGSGCSNKWSFIGKQLTAQQQ